MASQQVWAVNSFGGYYSNNQLSKELRIVSQPLFRFRTFAQPMREAGKNKGDIVYFNKHSNIATQGGTLSETSTIPRRSYSIQRGSLTVTEYGNALAMTEKLKSLSDISVSDAVRKTLLNDQVKVLDSAAAAQFIATKYKAVCVNTASVAFTTDGTATATSTANLSDRNVRDIVDRLRLMNVPTFGATGEYMSICSVNAIRGLYDFFEAAAVNTTLKATVSGEVGSYYGTKFVMETNYLPNNLGGLYGGAVFFGDDAVREGIVVPEEVRIDIPKDFGRDQSIAWYYLGGFQRVWDYSVDSEERIIHVTSA